MMAASGEISGGLGFVAVEDRDYDRYVREVRPTAIGIVQHVRVAAPDTAPVAPLPARLDDRADALAH